MKKIWILLLICGMNVISFGQVVNNYTIILNNDNSPLNATFENENVIYNFKKTDVLTITFKELKSDISKKTIKVTSDSKNNEISIGTFDRTDIKGDNSYTLNIQFSKLQDKLHSGINIYTIKIKDEKGQQNLLRFKLL